MERHAWGCDTNPIMKTWTYIQGTAETAGNRKQPSQWTWSEYLDLLQIWLLPYAATALFFCPFSNCCCWLTDSLFTRCCLGLISSSLSFTNYQNILQDWFCSLNCWLALFSSWASVSSYWLAWIDCHGCVSGFPLQPIQLISAGCCYTELFHSPASCTLHC